ncbi:MAG: hypothetical protein CW346_11945 [Bacillaceae bacterium]|nr:hypothetical protein [Bacillaceae bacterium]
MEPLWNLIRTLFANHRPRRVGGIDPRHAGRYAKADLLAELEGYVRRLDGALLETERYPRFRGLLQEMLDQESEQKVSALDRQLFFDFLWDLIRLAEADESPDASFWRQALWNLDGAARHAWALEVRDRTMTRNVLWSARERYLGARVIVRTHNYHAVKDPEAIARAAPEYGRQVQR